MPPSPKPSPPKERGCHWVGRDCSAIEPVAKAVSAAGGEAIIVPCDLNDPRQCEDATATTKAQYGRIDILVNVAGGSGPIGKTGVETTPDEFDAIVTLNMNGSFHTMRSVLPAMIDQRYGKIVNVGGTFGMRGRAGPRGLFGVENGACAASPRASRWKSASTTSTSIASRQGMVDGPRFRDKVCADMAKRLNITVEEAATRHAAEYALKRVTVDRDVANACLFLASDASRQITGIDLPVDGGWAML